MTPLYIARRTGASVVGVDIDPEAVELGRQVATIVASDDLDIRLEKTPVQDLAFAREASHVIFSSTVAVKYDLLHKIHSSTRDDVVVAMRCGDHLKSLFNYPMREVDRREVEAGRERAAPRACLRYRALPEGVTTSAGGSERG